MCDELVEYQKKLNYLLYSDSEAVFANYSQNHARCIFRTFIDAALDSIIFLSGDFGQGVFQEESIKNALVAAVKRGVKIRVISLSGNEVSLKNLKLLEGSVNSIPNEKNCGGYFRYRIGTVRGGARVQHFMVVDGKRYRLEEYHEAPVPDNIHAEVCCNNKMSANAMSAMFNIVWGRLEGDRG